MHEMTHETLNLFNLRRQKIHGHERVEKNCWAREYCWSVFYCLGCVARKIERMDGHE